MPPAKKKAKAKAKATVTGAKKRRNKTSISSVTTVQRGLLTTLPSELVAEIMKSFENIEQVISLASTCRVLYTAWKTHTGAVIWDIGRIKVPCFNDALMATRATQIVESATVEGNLPPNPFPIAELSGQSRKPSLEEYKAVLDLQFLVNDLIDHYNSVQEGDWEYILETCQWCSTEGCGASYDRRLLDRIQEQGWDTIIDRSFYRIFLIGAVLCRHYQEPFHMGPDYSDDQETDEQAIEYLQKEQSSSDIPVLHEEVVQYLERFPVYKMMEYDGLEKVFGPLVSWFRCEDVIRLRTEQSKILPKIQPKSRAVAELSLENLNLLQETLILLQAFDFLVDSPIRIWNDRLRSRTDNFKAKRARLLRRSEGEYRKVVPVVMMDYYQLGEMLMLPPVDEESEDSYESDESLDSDEYDSDEDDEDDEKGNIDLSLQLVLQKKGRFSFPEKRVSPSQNIAEILEALYKR